MPRKGKFVAATVKQKKKLANYCFYCFRPIIATPQNSRKLYLNSKTVDHFIPLTRGGTNFQYNMVICCHQCNTIKADLLPNEFNSLINQMWQSKDCFKYSKTELRNIIKQVRFISGGYNDNMRSNNLYYLSEIPKDIGMLEKLRKKYINGNEVSFIHNKHGQAGQCAIHAEYVQAL